jgi:hypothetical protein
MTLNMAEATEWISVVFFWKQRAVWTADRDRSDRRISRVLSQTMIIFGRLPGTKAFK